MTNRRKYVLVCAWCKKQFRCARPDARYHAGRCQKAAWRDAQQKKKPRGGRRKVRTRVRTKTKVNPDECTHPIHEIVRKLTTRKVG